ncbi:hypothetical protein C3747_133g38 [Trypanosoma cruzi]|uniref:Thioredoxin-like fold domain-containing protein n=2 Tax=Trypanosoma cruzi TaxID=5693 RepID=Q4DQP1_TRYCC|nr:hypothetical protein, conserved [Trypanosoma cruzi]EAN94840.1 hypothetical protein, conserved [Trypanosoma cruzi]KAF5214774.1 hypothetical protein ECC02_012589 [Trypanosoma cruzi]KAF5215829.1 hypothetical protein ECC02_011438 [Trypanosoma cruzi]KAF5217477.1 hypothetical protein ECC02_009655 [Trypanosoma cruzi]KAF8277197.1 hypothetical protein TcYC6_0017170 [Trypanosoma cruzi]|eukprot:XP_816691.1 hypothetical protein [Trypanosoma cruzi strain CL Brener]
MRRTAPLRRTSRRGPGGWTEPTLRQAAALVDGNATSGAARGPSTSFVGTPSPAVKSAFGVDDFSMIRRQQMTFTKLIQLTMDATFRPKDSDSQIYGGDGATQRTALREELKTMDRRITPFAHEELLNDYLKNIVAFSGPSGQVCDRELLRGRLVGLLFFTESEWSLAFMRKLKSFHQRHRQDFVVIAISLAGKEMMDVTRQHGFFHCAHRDGATWVSRDAGVMIRPLTPLPRLIVVDGKNGEEITRSGLTAVLTHPDTCFAAWRRGAPGHEWWDYLKTFYL